VIDELLADDSRVPRFIERLQGRGLTCHTLNAFPYGDFHSRRVKENVYLPDWADRKRLEYTVACARVLGALLPAGAEGSISTVPLAFKGFTHPSGHLDQCIGNLLELATALDRQHQETGRIIRLAIEPEPFCLLETTAEAIEFFHALRSRAESIGRLDVATRYLGLCYDVCHQAVEFEDIPQSISALDAAGIRINKVHITCALELNRPAVNRDQLLALSQYVEERYLHQTFARSAGGKIVKAIDLSEELVANPPREFLESDVWRVHFHVPVDAEHLGPLGTTRNELRQALGSIAALDYAPHLEVETYTWQVLPGEAQSGPERLVAGLTAEIQATRALLRELRG
jgi:sugar phosphate isomerase/epimerase